jgi:hypothetical protein
VGIVSVFVKYIVGPSETDMLAEDVPAGEVYGLALPQLTTKNSAIRMLTAANRMDL